MLNITQNTMTKKSKQASNVYSEELEKPRKSKMRIYEKDIKSIKKMNIDDSVELTIKGKIVEIGRDTYTDKRPISASIEIDSITKK